MPSGHQTPDRVFEDIKKAIEPYLIAEVVELNQMLLNAISSNDWQTYAALCDKSITAFEGEAKVSKLHIVRAACIMLTRTYAQSGKSS
jgi:hypothetical protein